MRSNSAGRVNSTMELLSALFQIQVFVHRIGQSPTAEHHTVIFKSLVNKHAHTVACDMHRSALEKH